MNTHKHEFTPNDFGMSQAVEIRDPYTAGHQRRVARLATAIAGEMGLADDRTGESNWPVRFTMWAKSVCRQKFSANRGC
jgi:HD-GYP domain-containing protein (c-di-GMP phosphodiesterase class II)